MTNNKSHILLVDDNPENIRVLGTILRQADRQLTVAKNGIEALRIANALIPDLILLDVMMPEISGFQVCEELKSNPKTKNIEIIFITAAIAVDEELKGLALGAVDYIHKPFSSPIVQAKVALYLERITNKKLREDIEHITRHDLKTPLNAIIAYPQLMLMDDNLPVAKRRKYLEAILNAGNEMLYIINNSLDILKMEKDSYSYKPMLVEMTVVIERVIRDLRMLREPKQINIITQGDRLDEVGFKVLAETDLSYSLFANLIRNAIEACPANDTIIIEMRYENNQGVISVTNPGAVPEEIRDSFFEKYVTSGKAHGTGLGTYSAKLITETQHGTISMATNDKETCITVRLPASSTPA